MADVNKKFNKEKLAALKIKARSLMLGNSWKMGTGAKIVVYILLILLGFIFVLPILRILSYSFMSPSDIVNPFVTFIPTSFYFNNYADAFKVLSYFKALGNSLLTSLLPSLFQCVAAALTGYGLARFRFPCKKLMIALVAATFILPAQVTMVPQMIMYTKLKLDNFGSFVIAALFGQGLNSAVFILIFYQFFSTLPQALIEAAKIDGANPLKIFISIGCPLAVSGFILTFLFSFVWYFNETVLTPLFLGKTFSTLPLQLHRFADSFKTLYPNDSGRNLNEAVYMAGTMLAILPLLIIYFVLQRHFVESIDKSGITGE